MGGDDELGGLEESWLAVSNATWNWRRDHDSGTAEVSEVNTHQINIQTCFQMGSAGSHPGLPRTRGCLLPVAQEASRGIPKREKKLPFHFVTRGNSISNH